MPFRSPSARTKKRELAERPTENAEAYDAYMRGKAFLEQSWKVSTSIRDIDRSISELKRAVALDPTFAHGWAWLTVAYWNRRFAVPGDSVSFRAAAEAAERATELGSADDPWVILVKINAAHLDGDKKRAIGLTEDAVKRGIMSPEILINHAFDLLEAGKRDSANRVIERAIRMNPRYAETRIAASDLYMVQRNWTAAEKNARALIEFDPTDERAWAGLARMGRMVGDTARIDRVIREAFRSIPSPSNLLLVFMVYGGRELGERFVRMTPEQVHIETLYDSVSSYYDNKADFYLRYGDREKANVYLDSIVKKVAGRNLAGPQEFRFYQYAANAYAIMGRTGEAARLLERATDAARRNRQYRDDGTPMRDPRLVAGVLARIGRDDEAVKELRWLVTTTPWTRAGLAMEPKIRALQSPAIEAFLRERE